MATIPIEVIVQDADTPVDPTPTPETNNTETNITVPDTGAKTLGNNTFSRSSAASIILPIVLLVVSLATICTLLIHRHHKRQDSKVSKKEKLSMSASATIAVLAATALVGDLILPVTKAATSDTEVSIEVPDKISIVVNREDDITEATTEATAYVTSTSAFGYKVLLSMAENSDSANLYLDGDNTSEYYIAPVEEGTLETNTWGYMLSDEEAYSAVPLADNPATIAEDADLAEDKALFTYYSVNIDKSLPAGAYTGELEYSIDAKPVPTTIGAITYMQDFAKLPTENKASVLASMREGEQYILKDIRDEKSYYISKLADGNVWMTQNLDLDLDSSKTYTPTDTDIPSNWSPEISTYSTGTSTWRWSDDFPDSYDPGDIYLGSIDDPHYHIGNYYNWPSAIATNDASSYTGEQEANQSICPSGWKLPKFEGEGSIQNLLIKQEIITGFSYPPLYMLYAGLWWGFSVNFNESGYYWSNIGSYGSGGGKFAGYIRIFPNEKIETGKNGNRMSGYSVRCVAR